MKVPAADPDPAKHEDALRDGAAADRSILTRTDWAPSRRGPIDARGKDESARLGFAPHALIFIDPAMVAVVSRAEQIAWSEASVLIQGESGTGQGGPRPLHPPAFATRKRSVRRVELRRNSGASA